MAKAAKHKVEVRDHGTYADVYFNNNRFGSVEEHYDFDTGEPQWRVFTNTFDTNRKVVDKNEGIAYLEALIAMGTQE